MIDSSSLIDLRTSVRRAEHDPAYWGPGAEWDTGACGIVSEEVEVVHGWKRDGGCYVPTATEKHAGKHVAHYWNVLPDGRILDVTADQFDGARAPRIVPADDSRYLTDCDGESCNNGEGAA